MTTLPFPHTAFLLLAVAVGAVVSVLLRGRWRWPAAIAAGLAAASGAATLGWVPWFGQLHFAAYGLLMLGGFIAGFLMIAPRMKHIGVPERWIIDLFIIAVLAGLAGARARYVYERPQLFLNDAAGHPMPWSTALASMADFDSGGMVWYGGALLATVLCVAYGWWRRLPILACTDIIVPGLLLGLGVGRIGCFLNGCCFGHPTTMPWGVTCAAFPSQHVHPTQLYETVVCGLLAIMLFVGWRWRRFDGQITLIGVLGYSAWRFTNEALRGDTLATHWWGLLPMSTSQATSIDLALAALVVAAVVWWRRRRDPLAAAAARRVPGSRYAGAATPQH